MIKIFQVDDTEWYAAETQEEAIAEAMRLTGEDRAFYEEETQGEVSDEAMDRLHFIEEDGIKKTFRQKLDEMIRAGEKFPCIFAMTEY